MGCDIHIHFEYYDEQKEEWINCDKFQFGNWNKDEEDFKKNLKNVEAFSLANVDYFRSYDIFGILAGVRCLTEPIKPLKGLPKDMHWFTRYILQSTYDKYGFSPTWYTLKELKKWKKSSKLQWREAVRNGGKIMKDSFYWYIYDEDTDLYVEKNYKALDGIIHALEDACCENCYLDEPDGDRIRMIIWFDN